MESPESSNNGLDLSEEDLENINTVCDDLIDIVVKFKSGNGATEADYTQLMSVLDFGKFVVSGIIYSNGMDLCSGHEHEDDEDGVE